MNLVITFVEIIVVMFSVPSLPETGLLPSTFLCNQRFEKLTKYSNYNVVFILYFLTGMKKVPPTVCAIHNLYHHPNTER